MESFDFEFERFNETEDIVFTANNIKVVIKYWWDSHGRMLEWKGPNGEFKETIHADSVKIIDREWDTKIFESICHEECSDAVINGKTIQALTVDYRIYNNMISIDAIVGAG